MRLILVPLASRQGWDDWVAANPAAHRTAEAIVADVRRQGFVEPLSGLRVPSGAAIPARLCQAWTAPAMPEPIRALTDSWAPQLPWGAIARFDGAAAVVMLRARFHPSVAEAFRAARTPRMRDELFRLAWLVAEGGFAAAADARCLGPGLFDGAAGLVPPGTDLLLVLDETGAPGTELLGAAAGHPLLREALARAVAAINHGHSDGAWLMTGPGLLARALPGALAAAGEAGLPGCHILDAAALGRVVATRCYPAAARVQDRPRPGGDQTRPRPAGEGAGG